MPDPVPFCMLLIENPLTPTFRIFFFVLFLIPIPGFKKQPTIEVTSSLGVGQQKAHSSKSHSNFLFN